ncbi:integral membrane sensor signal transduction histidine kinase [Dehalogenimonas lykanthroporepellens BL-DC-9]|nr:integral membrane sensor signal transduction histidine kinase [Dehalogenimonas lykanthroporepellens BL-DC-9]
MKSLTFKLGAALVLVAVVAVAVMAFLTNQYTKSEFQTYVSTNPSFSEAIANTLAVYYLQNDNSWDGVGDTLPSFLAFNGDRLILADNSGTIVADTGGELVGTPVNQTDLFGPYDVELFRLRKVIGQFYYIAGHTGGMGSGMGSGMGGMGPGGNNGGGGTVVISNAEEDFLAQTNRWLWISGGLAVAGALLIASILASQISRPLRALNAGARELAAGNLSHRVKVSANDETGRLAESFNVMASALEKSEQSRKRLLADVAHELRTPLTVINGTVDAMMDGVLPTDEQQLGTIKEESLLLTRLIADLRDLSLAEAGQLKLDKSVIDLGDLVCRKLEQFRLLAETRNIRLECHNPGGLPSVNGDWVRLEQVLANLLSNALRHTPAGGEVSVRLTEASLDGSPAVAVAVSDTGEGMTPEDLKHIFDRFYRVEDSRSRDEGGAGLGLAIVKQMVTAHSGRVSVESAPGRGTTFTVTLPAQTGTG